MTMDRSARVERALPVLFDQLAEARTPDYLEAAIERASSRPQRRAWTFPERWLPVELVNARATTARIPWRPLGVLALLAILLAATLFAYAGSRQRLPEPFGPAANGQIVYSKGGDIFIRDSINGASRPLVATSEEEASDSLSPLGTHVLAVTFKGEELYLASVPIAGGDQVQLGGPFRNVAGISWSPDESSIAIAHEVDGRSSISILNADGSGARILDLGMPADTPLWRPPDGAQLSFRGEIDGNWALFLANPDGSGVVQVPVTRDLMEAPYEVLNPAWSPDGGRIAFHRLVPTPGNGNGNGFRIHVAEIDRQGGVAGQRTFEFDPSSDEEMSPQWLPDGKQLVFTRHDVDTDYLSIAEPIPGASAHDLGLTSDGFIGNLRIAPAPDGTFLMVHKLTDNTDWRVDVISGAVTPTDINGTDYVWIQRRAP